MLKVGDMVGGIYKRSKGEKEEWILIEDKINKISELKSGKRYYTKSKFRPLDAEDVDSNTEIQEQAEGYILTKEVFGLNDITRLKAEKWVEWANDNMNRAVGVLDGYMILPKHHPQYGGTLTYYKDLDIGTKFFVSNGAWDGQIIEENGIKKLKVLETGRVFVIKDDDYAWINL